MIKRILNLLDNIFHWRANTFLQRADIKEMLKEKGINMPVNEEEKYIDIVLEYAIEFDKKSEVYKKKLIKSNQQYKDAIQNSKKEKSIKKS